MAWRLVWVALCLGVTVGCESPRKHDPAPVQAHVVDAGELGGLTQTVQNLRDREFKSKPRLEAVDTLPEPYAIASDAARAERELLLKVLFGFDAQRAERIAWLPRAATYDPAQNVVRYVRTARAEEVRRDVVLALVEALNRENFDVPAPAATWDGWLAQRAAWLSDAAYVWTLVEGQARGLDSQKLQRLPGLAMSFPDVARQLEVEGPATRETLDRREVAFALREGLSLSAALHRSGGWSSAELTHVSPPPASAYVVRPDRWAAGEGLGTWSWPSSRAPQGWTAAGQGSVGVGVLSLWVSDVLKPAFARAVYAKWQSDAYRVMASPQADWWMEYVTFWATPDDAQQLAELLDAGLRQRTDAEFTVLRNGATVAVVGASKGKTNPDDRLAAVSQLSALSPTFAEIERPFFTFSPTVSDAYADAVQSSSLDTTQNRWRDDASNLTMSVEALADWKLAAAQDFVARFVATREEATILMSTELDDVLGPDFESADFESKVVDNFKRTLSQARVDGIERVDTPLPRTIHATLTGKVSGDTRVAFWMARNGNVLVTFSVKAPPESFDSAYRVAANVWSTASFQAVDVAPQSEGVLKFEVEP